MDTSHNRTPRARVQVIYGLLEFVPDRIKIPENVRELADQKGHHNNTHEHDQGVEDRLLHVRW